MAGDWIMTAKKIGAEFIALDKTPDVIPSLS